MREKLLSRAQTAKRESKHLDFKGRFDTTSAECWCEILKDIVAFANSGGGIIVFGAESNGAATEFDHALLLKYDSADIANKIFKYTNFQFSDFEIVEVVRSKNVHAAVLVAAADVPLAFTKPGTYDIGGGRQKTAFSQGSVYFRHGAKSEPGHRDDFASWRDRELEKVRRDWLSGVRKVVEAPTGSIVTVTSELKSASGLAPVLARITADPQAAAFVPRNAEEIWPHRRGDVLRMVNKRLGRAARINAHDITSVNRAFDVFRSHPEFAYRSHHLASPQYSEGFVNWLLAELEKDVNFFKKARLAYRAS